jgi:hypothetical protein
MNVVSNEAGGDTEEGGRRSLGGGETAPDGSMTQVLQEQLTHIGPLGAFIE